MAYFSPCLKNCLISVLFSLLTFSCSPVHPHSSQAALGCCRPVLVRVPHPAPLHGLLLCTYSSLSGHLRTSGLCHPCHMQHVFEKEKSSLRSKLLSEHPRKIKGSVLSLQATSWFPCQLASGASLWHHSARCPEQINTCS